VTTVIGTPATPASLDRGRARLPDIVGTTVSPDGVRIAYEVYGTGDPTIVLVPSAPIVHSRQWKGQVPFLSRHYRVVTYDGRGNGRSDRPTRPDAYSDDRFVGDLVAVLDATMDASGTGRAVLVGLCTDGVWRAIRLAAAEPDRVLGIVAFGIGVPRLTPSHPWYAGARFDDDLPVYEGWAKLNRHHWRRDYPDFASFFFEEITSEPHSTKVIEDAVAWALDGSPEAMIADADAEFALDAAAVEEICRSVRCPMVLVHGSLDTCQPIARAERLAEITGAPLTVVEGADHMIPGRHPVLANLLIRDFVRALTGEMQP
jgi:pimeloyl-ACP methyl ester carboxylesterase